AQSDIMDHVKPGKKSSSNKNYKVWRHENHPVALITNSMVNERIIYIHQNPVRAGICYTAEDYKYSSAGAYAWEIGILVLMCYIIFAAKVPDGVLLFIKKHRKTCAR
nr:hypothetical protein [Bacteroidota bacterium]